MKPTVQCHKCKQQFRREELVEYMTLKAHNSYRYCLSCLQLVQAREKFDNEISKIFGIPKADGKINKQRKKLIEQGYTDQTIIDCLHYVYDIKGIKKETPTLYFVNQTMIEEMTKYKKNQAAEGSSLAQAMAEATSFKEYIVPIREAKPREKEILDPNDFLDD